jgi:hypothetical protein
MGWSTLRCHSRDGLVAPSGLRATRGPCIKTLNNRKAFFISGKWSLPNVTMLSRLQIKRSLKKNHEIFSVNVNEIFVESKENKIAKQSVKSFLDKFKDVFPNEMNKVSPMREVAHAIDLVVYATSIAKARYRHFLDQNVALENQLSDLLN